MKYAIVSLPITFYKGDSSSDNSSTTLLYIVHCLRERHLFNAASMHLIVCGEEVGVLFGNGSEFAMSHVTTVDEVLHFSDYELSADVL